MPTTTTTTLTNPARPRVWLVAGLSTTPAPTGPLGVLPTVRDDRQLRWVPGADGRWHTPDGRHHATWDELHTRTDLVEVTPPAAGVVVPDRELGDGDDDTHTSTGRTTRRRTAGERTGGRRG